MLQINNSPVFTGEIYKGDKLVSSPNAAQDKKMIQVVSDEILLKGAVKKSEVAEGKENKDTRTNYMIGDSFELTTVIGPTNTPEGGGMRYRSHDVKSLEFGYSDNDGNKNVWKISTQYISESLKDIFRDLFFQKESEDNPMQSFIKVLKG